jgi:hypothetical protein
VFIRDGERDDEQHLALKNSRSPLVLLDQNSTRLVSMGVTHRCPSCVEALAACSRLGGPDGEILVEGVHNALCEACRVLMSRGIIGSFEIRKPGLDYPCMTGDIEKVADLTVYEPDDGTVHFGRWRPFDQNTPSRSAVPAPAREDVGAGRGE